MNIAKGIVLLALAGSISACNEIVKDHDRAIDSKHLSNLKAGIWVDPNGCDHWIIDDGFEGYLSARLDKYGKPVCSGVIPENHATDPFKDGTTIPDPI